jgi:hypothetical protein
MKLLSREGVETLSVHAPKGGRRFDQLTLDASDMARLAQMKADQAI